MVKANLVVERAQVLSAHFSWQQEAPVLQETEIIIQETVFHVVTVLDGSFEKVKRKFKNRSEKQLFTIAQVSGVKNNRK